MLNCFYFRDVRFFYDFFQNISKNLPYKTSQSLKFPTLLPGYFQAASNLPPNMNAQILLVFEI